MFLRIFLENIKRVESWRHVFAQYGEGRVSCGRGDKSGEEIFLGICARLFREKRLDDYSSTKEGC